MAKNNFHIWGKKGNEAAQLLTSTVEYTANGVADRNYFKVDRLWITTSRKLNPEANPETVLRTEAYTKSDYAIEIVRIAGCDPFGSNFLPEARETVTVEATTAIEAKYIAPVRMHLRVMGQELQFFHNGVRING